MSSESCGFQQAKDSTNQCFLEAPKIRKAEKSSLMISLQRNFHYNMTRQRFDNNREFLFERIFKRIIQSTQLIIMFHSFLINAISGKNYSLLSKAIAQCSYLKTDFIVQKSITVQSSMKSQRQSYQNFCLLFGSHFDRIYHS